MVGDIFQPTHLLLILVVALFVLGPKRLPEVGRTLGSGIRDFRSALSGDLTGSHDEHKGVESADDGTRTVAAPTPQSTPAVQPAPTAGAPAPAPVAADPEPAPHSDGAENGSADERLEIGSLAHDDLVSPMFEAAPSEAVRHAGPVVAGPPPAPAGTESAQRTTDA